MFSKQREAQEMFKMMRPMHLKKIKNGLASGLESGPLLSFPTQDCLVTVHGARVARGTQV